MTEPADLIVTGAEVHTLGEAGIVEAIAIRNGRVIKCGDSPSVGLLEGVDTTVIDGDGRTVIPGFVDGHTHLQSTGRYLVFADLSGATDRDDVLARLTTDDGRYGDWTVGIGYDESRWSDGGRLTRDDLDSVSTDRPVVAFRVDMHTASLNSVALDRVGDELPAEYVKTEDGRPTGIILEDALSVVRADIGGDDLTRTLLTAAQEYAHSVGVTAINDYVRSSTVARTYHELDRDDELTLRVRLNYWRDHLDAIADVGLVANQGSEHLTIGAIKSFSDGSVGGRTAKVSEPYTDGNGTGRWVVEPETLRDLVDRIDEEGHQVAIHAIGDVAVEAALSAIERADDASKARHRIEHVELATDDHLERMADAGVIASMQPNFHQWGDAGGLYETSLGDRHARMNRFRDVLDAGVPLAFGSDSMPLDPLYGVHCAVTARYDCQRLTVDEAIEAYTIGAAYAGFDENRLGRLVPGYAGDCVVLDQSPWEVPSGIENIEVTQTVVGGELVYEAESSTHD